MFILIEYIKLVFHRHFIFPDQLQLLPAGLSGAGISDFEDLLRPVLFAAEDEGRTEDPTEQRIRKEREQGRVAKSPEIPSALVTIGGIVIMFILSGWILHRISRLMELYLGNFSQMPAITDATVGPLLNQLIREITMILGPVFLVAVLMAIAGNLVQSGFLFSLKPLAFDLSRIKLDFTTMIKKIFFSRQIAVNLIKSLLKLVVLIAVSYFIIRSDFLSMMQLGQMGVSQSLHVLGFILFKLGIILSIFLMAFAIPDFIYQKYEFKESLKMTKEELKQEYKETEGDPLVKQRQRQRAIDMIRRNMLKNVKQADVVITNPTHFAVAVRYVPGRDLGPVVVAKGEDHLAFRIRNLARNENIPIVENRPLARELYYKVEEGQEIPYQFWTLIAEIYNTLGLAERKVS